VKNILIIQTAFIGDVILATPLLSRLKDQHPQAKISMLVRRGNESLVQFHPNLHEVLIWDKRKSKYANVMRLISKIRKKNFDTVINLQRFGASGLMTWLSGASNKIGFDKNPFAFCYTTKKPHNIGDGTHEIERNLSLIEDEPQLVRPEIHVPEIDRKKAEQFVVPNYVCIAPASVWFTKQYPVDGWIKLCDNLAEETSIYLLGGPGDEVVCNKIISKSAHPKIQSLCGALTLLQSAALMAKARMNYVNDSAPLHLASAMNAPVRAVFCSTIPDFGFGPVSKNARIVQIQEDLPCRPCGLHGKKACPEGHFKCATMIKTEQFLR
jgi:lipopolysaccharide heptosyltransferase II